MGFTKTTKNRQKRQSLYKTIHYLLTYNDDEIDRTHHQHYVYREIWSEDFSAPVKNLLISGVDVLDIGCGPGTWILELGTKYEKSNFKGIDAFAFFPSTIKPQNVSFEQHNILNGLPFENNKFEYVIMRFMMFSLSLKEWENVINEMVRVCKPNGWIEIMEDDLVLHNRGPRTDLMMKIIIDELERKGVETIITPHILKFLETNPELPNIANDERYIQLGKCNKVGELYLESLKWGAKNLFESEHLFERGLRGVRYDGLIEDFVQECNEECTFTTSVRFYARVNKKHVVETKKNSSKIKEFFKKLQKFKKFKILKKLSPV
ncbi:hypothetical protein GLOIN_2v1652504 [Rhizophagus irregularis DAOM 181602=DAOM 197198]|uniref:Methyltransferase domain-containing protein n=2 Tax=Rhizophagus irregularis TaxID=588596 RepID=A0A015KD64_RHIIW|nr:hypothetical protein GLOIN_2v1652504 [Rhizophagus irregularis DAOM 181602=DAOM 197198]EXX57466.1 hypothetical protein RirG_206890 [Rhizophagus irregularis DAOM 197198w]POG66947.1 hypothetical protein GLOIN_2v1652504 [Rhizophagus irregularis DAOM 181602=DAOM 197198]|eukprot:XP_025173813.1 hypothetical protein GLOIN_2v1652504 [Rhizophagus irregularis DAOM 181602=DAOM 197198]